MKIKYLIMLMLMLALLAVNLMAQTPPPVATETTNAPETAPPEVTEALPYLDKLVKFSDGLAGLPALPLLFIGCLAIGYILKWIPKYPNDWIPLGVIAGGVLGNLSITPLDDKVAWVRAVLIGAIAGVAAVWVFGNYLKDKLDWKKAPLILLLASLALGLTGCAGVFNPAELKPAPVAEGQDEVVVNAERVQKTSLFAYEKMINWELANRAVLPAEVSRAVDEARKHFLPNWRASRAALEEYKQARGGNLDNLHRLTTALSVAQANFLKLTGSQQEGDIGAVFTALTQLNDAVGTLRK